MTALDPHDEYADFDRLDRALRSELRCAPPWTSLCGSLSLHGLALIPLLLIPSAAAPEDRAAHRHGVVQLFAPIPQPDASFPVVSARTSSLLADPSVPLREAGRPDVRVDFSSIRLSFAPDLKGELPLVVERQNGALALVEPDDRSIARYFLEPPAWNAEERIQDVSGNFRIIMTPPEKWAVFREAARRRGIDLSRYDACALFDLDFRHCLKKAILASAAKARRHGVVASARLAIAAGLPCGIEVLEVSFAAP